MKNQILQILLLCLVTTAALAQSVTVKGRVTDKATKAPVFGASVALKSDLSKGTITNDTGEFTLTVSGPDAKVIIHSFGYQDIEIQVGNQTFLEVIMDEEAKGLEEIVVVGAVVRRESLTGSVASINAAKISQTPTNNINQALQGKVAGAYVVSNSQPGSDASIKIRGNNSIQFGTNPIFVVDGVIIDGGFNTLNPDDIASIDVLKDAASTAIYGSRGANGVVVVTTKKGRSGAGKVSYNAWFGVQSFSKKVDLMKGKDLFDLRVDAYANAFIEKNPQGNRQQYINDSLMGPNSLAFAQYELDAYRQGKSYDWLDAVTRKGFQQNHTLNFSGGTEKGSYFLSFNYTDQKGIVKSSGYKRLGGRMNLEQAIKPWLKVGTNTSFTNSKDDYVDGSVFSVAAVANPLLPVDTAGYYLKYGDIENQDAYNPLRSLSITGDNISNRLLSANYVNISPIKDLNIRSTVSFDLTNQQTFWYTPMTTGQDRRNSNHGKASQRKDVYNNLQWDNTISYNKSFGPHYLSVLAGTSLQKNQYNYNQVDAFGFPNDDFGYKFLGGAYSKDKTSLSSDFITTTLLSFLGRADYSYNDKYFVTATLRYDGSSRFGANNKWGAFPSLALAYDMSKEGFMSNLHPISRLKWRVGYGIAGNQNIPNYAFASLYRPNYTNNSVTYVSDGRLGNPNLHWERQKQLNLGVDLGLFDNRLMVTADYFNINNDDLLMVKTLSTTTGFTNTVSNVGALNNKGIEFAVSGALIRKQDFQWNVNLTVSHDQNKVTALYGDTKAIYNKGGYTGVEIQRTGNLFLGESLNSVYSYKFDKIAQQADMERIKDMDFAGRTVHPGDIMPVDKDGNGVINDDDRYVVGKLNPKFYGGFGTDVTYKGFGFNMFFNYSYGLKRLSGLYEGLMSSSGVSAAHEDLKNRWTPENTNTNVPRALYGIPRYSYGDTDLGLQNASFLRLSTLTVSYTLPRKVASVLRLENTRFYVTGANMLRFTKDRGYDPETGDGYPNSKMLTAGLNITF
ncbi:TonB-linked outer membrane protein, SusC/RagA family [Dyadobacter sp. SG02]|uniref:SusC/RagA family TonB-linked outer membrane protein n=1 Tax=Dyadobacter sp. SG02 TaxID=1855291 RepID=UPI0008BBC82E|nr:TonB-dependent receptor [Dyadobacter sp. SG02]SEI54050.1 TonB-linked outer membrane protein, SusC/RagA family [Dyadobacter sp. SG02]